MILLALSGVGMFWLTEQKKKEAENIDSLVKVKPTITVIEKSEESTAASMLTPKLSVTLTPTIATNEAMATPSVMTTPTPKAIEIYESKQGGFIVKYKGTRKIYEENESSGKRYIFYSYSGNITVHVGNSWSWLNSGRTFSEALLVDGEKTYVYEISNQKIVDLQKNDKKYTIQCVHNDLDELKAECDKFLTDFSFI
jgi:hypothetical protein